MSDAHRDGWAAAHHGLRPESVPGLARWLRAVRTVAEPLARVGVPPLMLTGGGVIAAVFAAFLADDMPWLALLLVLASVGCDAIDGSVAVLSGTASRRGEVADRAADRICDCLFALILWRVGAPWWLALLAAGTCLLHEGFREWRGGVLLVRLTVAERPTRVICTVIALALAGYGAGAWTATVCATVWIALTGIGFDQLLRRAGPST
jgi:CDP-diacylglycerol--glycerol-3-phosphate 3-phosphatidyltransferase